MRFCGYFLIGGFFLISCTQQQVYESLDENRRQECEKYTDYQREKCLESIDIDYREYQEIRDAEI